VRLGVSLITLEYAKMDSFVYLAHLHRPLISTSTPKNQRPMEGAQSATIVSLVTPSQGLVSQAPITLILDKANATYAHVDNIVQVLLLVAQVDCVKRVTFVEREKLYPIQKKVLKLTIITLRVEFKEFYALMAIT
jgi:hypothetical protein